MEKRGIIRGAWLLGETLDSAKNIFEPYGLCVKTCYAGSLKKRAYQRRSMKRILAGILQIAEGRGHARLDRPHILGRWISVGGRKSYEIEM